MTAVHRSLSLIPHTSIVCRVRYHDDQEVNSRDCVLPFELGWDGPRVSTKGRVINYGEGGGIQKSRRGGRSVVLPLQKREGGPKLVCSHAGGGGGGWRGVTTSFEVVFTREPKVLAILKGSEEGGGAFWTCNFPIL